MNILWFKAVKEIADNSKDFKATVTEPWNPKASFAVYQYEEGWTQKLAKKHASMCECKGEIRETASGNGVIAYKNAKQNNASSISSELLSLLQAGTSK
tara:strand:+ start:467 stop:760 length:294 start_codon:yes stop_codon:yes gene_type:complete